MPHPLALGHTRGPAQGSARHRGVGGNGTTLAPRDGRGWQRATRVATDDDPHRIARLACMRLHDEHVPAHAMIVCADARDRHLRPQVGAAWRPQGTPAEVMTPGKPEQYARAGALSLATGKRLYGLGPRKNQGLFGIS